MFTYKAIYIKLDEVGIPYLQSLLDDGWEPVRETPEHITGSMFHQGRILCVLRKAKS
jgi:hypothetical protein